MNAIAAMYAKLVAIRQAEELRLDAIGEYKNAADKYDELQYELEQMDKIISDMQSLTNADG